MSFLNFTMSFKNWFEISLLGAVEISTNHEANPKLSSSILYL